MEMTDYLRFVFAFAFVLSLIGILALLAKRYGMGYRRVSLSVKKRLSISEIMPIDAKRRLVLLKRDDKEHLVMIGGATDLVIEQNIRTEDNQFEALLQQVENEPPIQDTLEK